MKNFEAQKFRDDLAKEVAEAPKEERKKILDRAKGTPEYQQAKKETKESPKEKIATSLSKSLPETENLIAEPTQDSTGVARTKEEQTKTDRITNIELDETTLATLERMRINPDFFYNAINSFKTPEELYNFSASIRQGEYCVLKFDHINSGALGEAIKYNFLKKFFRKYFPKLQFFDELERKEQQKAEKQEAVITTRAIDFKELQNRRAAGDKSYFPEITDSDISKVDGYSMIQMKPLDIAFPTKESAARLRKKIEQQINFHGTIIVTSLSNSEQIPDLIECAEQFPEAKILVVQGTGFHDAISIDKFEKDVKTANLQIHFINLYVPPGNLRYLYSIGDYAFVPYNKNKLEPVACEVPVITTKDFGDESKNSNIVLDKVLDEAGLIQTLDSDQPTQKHEVKLTNNLLYRLVEENTKDEKEKGVPGLKDETQRIFNEMKNISLKLNRNFISRYLNRFR